jgi:hypothetical protein
MLDIEMRLDVYQWSGMLTCGMQVESGDGQTWGSLYFHGAELAVRAVMEMDRIG